MNRPTLVLVLFAAIPFAIPAAEAIFTLDPSRSSISLEGSVLGIALREQGEGSGSLTTQFEGTIAADLTDTTLRFPGQGASIRARNNGTWQPAPGGEAGSAPANFAGQASSFVGSATAAARNVEFNLASETLPLANGAFDSSQVLFQFVPGGGSTFDYRVTGLLGQQGQVILSGLTTNRVAGSSTLVTANGIQTLTIPVQASYAFTLLLENDGQLHLSGQLVATREIGDPQPGFDAFIASAFPGVTDPNIIGASSDPDGDGIPNFVEFAFGLAPDSPDPGFRPLSGRADAASPTGWVLEYIRPTGLAGVRYGWETGPNLFQWAPLDASPQVADLGNGREKVTLALDRLAAAAAEYVRLIVSQQ